MSDMRIVIDFPQCEAMLKKLRTDGAELLDQSSQLVKAADPSGIFEGEGGDAYLQYLDDFEKGQKQITEAVESLAAIVERFTGAVKEGNTDLAVSILNG